MGLAQHAFGATRLPETAISGGWVAKERIPAVLNFDNCVSIQVRGDIPNS